MGSPDRDDGRAAASVAARMSCARAGSRIGSSSVAGRSTTSKSAGKLDLVQPLPGLLGSHGERRPAVGERAARRSERKVRPPVQIGTRSCTAHGSTTMPSKS